MDKKETQSLDENIELSDYVKELIKPENIGGPFKTTEELMNWALSEDD